MAGDEHRLDLLDSVECDADDDEEGGATKEEGDVVATDEDIGEDADASDIDSATEGDATKDAVDVLSGELTGLNARDGCLIFLQIISYIDGVKDDRGVEVAEEDDESDVDDGVLPLARHEDGGDGFDPVNVVEVAGDGCRKHEERAGEDRGDNASGVDLEGEEGALTSVDLAADEALGILNGYATLSALEEADEGDRREDDEDDHQHSERGNIA